MEITEIKITPIENTRIKAYVAITFDDMFVVKSIRLLEGRKGLYLRMPNRKKPDGSFQDVAHPISNSLRQKMEESVIKAYEEIVPSSDSYEEVDPSSGSYKEDDDPITSEDAI